MLSSRRNAEWLDWEPLAYIQAPRFAGSSCQARLTRPDSQASRAGSSDMRQSAHQ